MYLLHGLKRPFRVRWVRRVVVGTTAVVLLGLLYMLGDRQLNRAAGNRELAEVVAEADLSDPDWRWDDLNKARKKPPEGKNSAEVIDRVRAASPKAWFSPEVPDSDPPNRKDTDEAIASIRKQLAASTEAVRLARTLRDYPSGYREAVLHPSNYFSSYAEATQNTRWAAATLSWDSRLALADGELLLASDNLIACLNASRSIGDDPDSISQIVRVSMRMNATLRLERALARTGSLPRLAELQSAWAADAEEPLLYHAMRGQRALYDRIFEGIENGTYDLGDFVRGKDWMGRIRSGLPSNRATILRRMTARVVAAKLPVEQQGAAFARDPWPDDRHPNLLMGAIYLLAHHSKSFEISTARMRCAIAGLACERFRLLKGRWPESLQEIPAELLAAVPLGIQLALLTTGVVAAGSLPALTVACALGPLGIGLAACLAYMFIDVERYEVVRGHKALHNPMKGAAARGRTGPLRQPGRRPVAGGGRRRDDRRFRAS